jgi:hypothetical protein
VIDVIAVSVFYEVAALLVLAAAVGLVGTMLRQPLIVSFSASPFCCSWSASSSTSS